MASKPRPETPKCSRCGDRGTYRADLPDSGDTGSGYVKCPCGIADRKLAAALGARK